MNSPNNNPSMSTSTTGKSNVPAIPSFPIPAYLNFTPGGLAHPVPPQQGKSESADRHHYVELALYSQAPDDSGIVPGPSTTPRNMMSSPRSHHRSGAGSMRPPDQWVVSAKQADDRLRQYTLLHQGETEAPHVLPSLSVLAHAAFGKLTGVPANAARTWADAMTLQFCTNLEETVPRSEADIWENKAEPPYQPIKESTATALRRMLRDGEATMASSSAMSGGYRPRPCGYVFKRGDIAWNCRTCQTDSTCVICDNCFRHSQHDGHEVFFHRTTPGGCCDCGDTEAWKVEGCCDKHRPSTNDVQPEPTEDPEEAVRVASKGRREGLDTLVTLPTALSPRFAAALGTVIGAAVNCLVQAVDGAGIGADPSQWKLRWTDDASKIWNQAIWNEDYPRQSQHGKPTTTTPTAFLGDGIPKQLPQGFRLHLRLHNDDVHTFDEVIEALHEPPRRSNGTEDDTTNPSLVILGQDANEMTHHVDSDGQVTVKTYSSVSTAMSGFRRLKSKGLHCAVVSTAQVEMEHRARALSSWLAEISAAHPAVAVLVVDALVQVASQQNFGGVPVWHEPRTIPRWVTPAVDVESARKRFGAFPPHLMSSYVTSTEAEKLHQLALRANAANSIESTGADPLFYSSVPYRLPSERYRKSPHALWGTLPSTYTDPIPIAEKHPLLFRLSGGQQDQDSTSIQNRLTELVFVVDTDLRKQQEADRITGSIYPHRLPGLHLISGIGTMRTKDVSQEQPGLPNPMTFRHMLATSSFRAPMSPIILLLLLDPYPTKQLRGAVHALFLSLLTDGRFKCRFAAALGIAYRPLSTLFCAGVGTEADTPLGFTVQILTAGSLVRALGSAKAVEKLLLPDDGYSDPRYESSLGVFTMPIGLTVVRCIHTNLLGATKEVHMILNNTNTGNDNDSDADTEMPNDNLLPVLTYVAGEHPLMTALPAAPDDGFLDSRSTRHKRLPHLLRDLEYVIETPGTAMRLLLPKKFPPYEGVSLSSRGEEITAFSTAWARLLRLAQGMDPQKRKIAGGHVEYEQSRWLEAFGLSLNFAGTRDALAESPTNSSSATLAPVSEDGTHLVLIREAMGNVIAAILKEMKLWLYREGMLETGLPVPPGGSHGASDPSQVEALQRSTLHVSGSQLASSSEATSSPTNSASAVALSCATGVKMSEAQLDLIESALRMEGTQRQYLSNGMLPDTAGSTSSTSGVLMGDWLRVPHSPLAGDSLSFHLPLHRALAKNLRSVCSVVVPESIRSSNSRGWWKLPVLDDDCVDGTPGQGHHPLVPLVRSTLRSANCRVVWSAGPDCSPQEAQRRKSRSRTVSANIAVAKVIHSIADHPIRCLSAAQQIERHLWARNGSPTAGMALNYSNAPLCRSFRDLDLTLVQLSAAGMSVGLGASRVFSLLISRFSMDGYLSDPERRATGSTASTGPYSSSLGAWVNPPRLQDSEHAVILSESLFATLCVLVSELPPPPPITSLDEASLRQSIRRELVHALAAEPRSHSAAMAAASCAVGRRDESDGSAGTSGGGGLFRNVFADVLKDVGKQKSHASRAASGPASFELSASCCDEYDPTFFHLRRQEHQHAMDVVSNLRKQKLRDTNQDAGSDAYCFSIVCPPPKAHPRFLPCRLMMHLKPMDAAIRRSLMFALFAGSWLPPDEPVTHMGESSEPSTEDAGSGNVVISSSASGETPVMTFSRRAPNGPSGVTPFPKRGSSSFSDNDQTPPFSAKVVASSSVSFLEVLQLLTLQVHTLEECASLHITQPDLDGESKALSSSLSINSYLGRLVYVPDSLVDVWALRTFPDGPLKSKGSGEKRASILGLLVALYEHRKDNDSGDDGGQDSGTDGLGGARSLAANGLKWLLRFVHALVDGAPSVATAVKSATTGIPIKQFMTQSSEPTMTIWTIDSSVRESISGMLSGVADLWPKAMNEILEKSNTDDKKNKERGKAAQKRMLDMMKKKQSAFAESMGPVDKKLNKGGPVDEEVDLCIICRCDDADGENNGPLGYLGHVQRSRVCQMRACGESVNKADGGVESSFLFQKYRVVGHMGCQVRESEAMDSKPIVCLPRGSIVTVSKRTVSDTYDILSRRVLVKHKSEDTGDVTEGWASIQSSQGYIILDPLSSLCYENTRWGNTRPIVRQCGHAAHLRCVETHTLSLHQRAAGDQPYDGRFAANIGDGEFLCPLCKQLSNILIPRDGCVRDTQLPESTSQNRVTPPKELIPAVSHLLTRGTRFSSSDLDHFNVSGRKALAEYGSHLLQAMVVPWERTSGARKRKHRQWHPAIQRWDYEEEEDGLTAENSPPSAKSILRLLRQQHIAWASVGHSAAVAEASVRGTEEILPFGTFTKTDDPWPSYGSTKDSDPMLLELTRTMTGATGLFEVLLVELSKQLSNDDQRRVTPEISVVGQCLSDIATGHSWILDSGNSVHEEKSTNATESTNLWSHLTALLSSIPAHVARDGMLSQRHEARAAAAAMWIVRGLGTQAKSSGEPPVPFAIEKVSGGGAGAPTAVREGWGTMHPTLNPSSTKTEPFRPAVATAFLYTPLLAWDLITLAGALFSSILLNQGDELPGPEDILTLGRVLIAGRTIQALVTPNGFDSPNDMEVDGEDDDDHWQPEEVQRESKATVQLLTHCQNKLQSYDLNTSATAIGANEPASPKLFASVGRAILPFARTVVLLMRACNGAVKTRQRRSGSKPGASSEEDRKLESVINGEETMTIADGFFILNAMNGPLPSQMIDATGDWLPLLDRWLTSIAGFEKHHGYTGTSAVPGGQIEGSGMDSNQNSVLGGTIGRRMSSGTDTTDENQMDQDLIASEQVAPMRRYGDDHLDDSDDELEEMEMDEAETMVDFADEVQDIGRTGFHSRNASANPSADASVDEPSSSGSDDGDGNETAYVFAGVSQAPIISYQASILGTRPIGPGRQGSLEAGEASAVMSDLSHLGSIHMKGDATFSLIRLPKSFVELYGIVNKVKGREENSTLDDGDDIGSSETAICLLTGSVMRSGSARRNHHRTNRPPGACTMHARKTGSGIGIFFLVQKCTVLLMHNNKSAYSASLFVDEHGEEDPGLRRGRPLFLNPARYRALELLWRQQGIPREVAQIRSTSDRVIRDNWY